LIQRGANHEGNFPVSADTVSEPLVVPRVTFYRLVPQARPPQRADRAAAGTLPTRAFRYCEPVVTASAFGYYVFPPINFSLMWDGTEVSWTYHGAAQWMPLRAAQFPGFAAYFDSHAPDEIRGFAPPFLGALQEPGLVQMWTGLVARTAPGWSLLVRPSANLPRSQQIELFEGVIETDRWFGPLITNFRLTRTGIPIDFQADFPILQVQPLPREVLDEAGLNHFSVVPNIADLRPQDWDDFYDTVVRPNVSTVRPPGEYAAAVRRRRKADDRNP
jgi:hypothetical protein